MQRSSLFQRTAYLRFPITRLYRWFHKTTSLPILPLPIYNFVVAVETRFGRTRVKALYQADMQQEYQSLRPWLPRRCSAVLDIGCGVAGIVATYLDRVHALLRDDGVVILDVRKGTDGLDLMRRAFADVEVMRETQKHYRVAARK